MIGNSFWFQLTDEKYMFLTEEREARSIIYYKTYSQEINANIKVGRVGNVAPINKSRNIL